MGGISPDIFLFSLYLEAGERGKITLILLLINPGQSHLLVLEPLLIQGTGAEESIVSAKKILLN
jgi:hypothetical protein